MRATLGHNYLAAFTAAITRHPWLALLAVLLLLLPLLASAGGVRPDNSLEVWFVQDDPALVQYRGFLEQFGNDEAIVIAYAAPAGWTAEELALQRALAERLRAIEGIGPVLASSDLPVQEPAALAAAGLASADGRTLALIAWMEARPDVDRIRGPALDEVRLAAREVLAAAGREPRLAGTGVLYEELNRQTLRDTGVFMTIALVLMLAVLWSTMRRWGSVAVAIIPALLAAGGAVGLLALAGRPMTMVTAALPTLVLVIALSDAVHFITHADAAWRAREHDATRAWRDMVARSTALVAVPCLYTSLTTGFGFLALTTSRMAVVRDFGLFAATGMLLAWVVVTVACTAGLAIRGAPSRPLAPEQRALAGGLERFMILVLHRRRTVFGIWIAVALLLGVGVTRLQVDTLTIGMLPEGHQVRADSDWIEQHLGYYTPLEFVVHASPPAALDGDVGGQALAWRAAIEQRPNVGRSFGWHEAAAGGLPGTYRSADGSSGRITAFVPMMSARGFDETGRALLAQARSAMPDARIEGGGYLPLYVRIIDYVVQSTVMGLALAFVLVFIAIGVLIRSWRMTLVTFPVNLFPVLLVFGVMGWTGIPLDIATATVGAIVLGIAVDDTIHFLVRYRRERRHGVNHVAAVAITAGETGRALVFTTLVLAIGFGVMMASGSASVAAFGFVTMVAVLGALTADLALLPVLLVPRDAIENRARRS
jgi:uncharacterized protein